MYYLGFDIGGSNIKAVLVNDKKILKSIMEKTPANLDGLLLLLEAMKNDLGGEVPAGKIGGVGFSLAGALDVKREMMLNSPNIQYLNGRSLKKLLQERMAPWLIIIEHDVHCFLQAEKEVGLARELKNVFYLTVGTGVGGAFMINREIFIGSHGASGEAGHMIIEQSTAQSLELLMANKFVKKLLGVAGDQAEKLVRQGDQKAKDLFAQRGRNLGVGIANIINVFDPDAVIIGGGIVSAQEFIVAGIYEAIEKYVISSEAKKTKIFFSQLGQFGGALGASLLFE
jgi:glucokinase